MSELTEPRLCKFYAGYFTGERPAGCSRGKHCKFAHHELDSHGNVVRRRITKANYQETVAWMTEETMLSTDVRRSNAPLKWLREFLSKHGAERILQDAQYSECGKLVTFKLCPEPLDYLVKLLQAKNDKNSSQEFLRVSESGQTEPVLLHPDCSGSHEGLYYTDVWNAIGALVTGHLVGFDRAGRHGCHFHQASPDRDEIKKMLDDPRESQVVFRARLYGMKLGKKMAPKIYGVVPIGVILSTDASGGLVTDMWSHELTEVTFCKGRLLMFLQAWKNAHKPVLSMPVGKIDPRNVREYSHRLIQTGKFDTQYDETSLQIFDDRCERLQTRHGEYAERHDNEMWEHTGIWYVIHEAN